MVVTGPDVVVVVSGPGTGGHGQVEKSGSVGPLTHPPQLIHLFMQGNVHFICTYQCFHILPTYNIVYQNV